MPRIFAVIEFVDGPPRERYDNEREWLSEYAIWIEAVLPSDKVSAVHAYSSLEDVVADKAEHQGAFESDR